MEYLGFLDVLSIAEISGWAIKRDGAGRCSACPIEIAIDTRPVEVITPDRFRSDVAGAGLGDGNCGFLRLPRLTEDFSLLPEQIRVSFLGTGIDVPLARTESIPLPAEALQGYSGSVEFVGVGEIFTQYLKDLCGLRPNSVFLDIGCGIGRMARPLTSFLSESGQYRGFDVGHTGIAWCRDNISPRKPNFIFHHADVRNAYYRPETKLSASSYRFPYDDDAFDVALASSVFTHVLPDVFLNYLNETARVLRRGGKALITMFLLNEESRALISLGKSKLFTFPYKSSPFSYEYVDSPEKGIAYEEDWVLASIKAAGLQLGTDIQYGMWCGRDKFLTYQDVLIVSPV